MAEISVVVPVYNCETYLNTCIDSILNQTFTGLELILVDDGSTDQSGYICDIYAQKDNRVKVIHKSNGGGAGEARNVGLDSASSPFICFTDSDDWLEKDMLEKLYRAQKKADSDVVVCGYKNIVSTEKDGFNFNTVYEACSLVGEKAVRDYFIKYYPEGMLGYPWNKLYRRALIMENNIRFPKMRRLEDGIFNVDFFGTVKRCEVISEPLYNYRVSQQVEQRKLPKDFYSLMETFVIQFYGKLKEWGYSSESEKSMVIYFLNDFVGCLENIYFSKEIHGKSERRQMLDDLWGKRLVRYMLKKERDVPRYSRLVLSLFEKKHDRTLELVIRIKIFAKTRMYNIFQMIKKVAN